MTDQPLWKYSTNNRRFMRYDRFIVCLNDVCGVHKDVWEGSYALDIHLSTGDLISVPYVTDEEAQAAHDAIWEALKQLGDSNG
jgi:hypothetical protein